MKNQLICLNASITQSKLPIMIQTKIRATNMRWGGTTLKSLQPCLCQCWIQLFATIDSHTIIAKQKCDDQIWMTEREILQEITNKQATWTWCKINQSASMLQWLNPTSNNDANPNPSNQYEMRRDDLKKFATLSRVNAKYNYLRQLTLTL